MTLTREMVAIDSVSRNSNAAISDLLEQILRQSEFEVERLEYADESGTLKVSLVAKKGDGRGGLALFSHSDTVPGTKWDRDPWAPTVENGKLIGLGTCDMKGPSAATIVAGNQVSATHLEAPLYIIVTADEEVDYGGAHQVMSESKLLQENMPDFGLVAEPTQLRPVYAHKGGCRMVVTARGKAAHTSTGKGLSATFLMAPFLAEMAELEKLFRTDASFMNMTFDPPTNGFNMVIDDGGCRPNVFSPETVCTLGLRVMPDARSGDAVTLVQEKAEQYGFEFSPSIGKPFYISPDADIVQAAVRATGGQSPETVPFGTEATVYQDNLQPVILGPGSVLQAHTNGEWIEIQQLQDAVEVYGRMIEELCV